MNYVHPQLITAHASLIGAPHHDQNADLKRLALLRSMAGTPQNTSPSRANVPVQDSAPSKPRVTHFSSGSSAGASAAADGDYKVTGTERFNQPDKDSQWDPGNGGRWIRKWLPGEKEAEALSRVLSVKDDFANIASERELKGKITLDDLRTQNAIGQYIQQKRADVASNPNIEILKGQLENARNTLFKSVAEKARGVPVSPSGGQNAGTDISAAIIPPQDQQQPSVDGQPLDYGAMFENGGRLFGQDGAVNNGNDGGDSSSFDSLYDQW